jgi:hypothetical protein
MAARRERSTLDTTKLLDLLLRLARSDHQVRPRGAADWLAGGRVGRHLHATGPACTPQPVPSACCLGCLPTWCPACLSSPVAFRPQCALPDRIINLIWDITMAPGAPKDTVDAGARHLADAAAEYRDRTGKQATLQHLVMRCHAELKQRRNHAAALKALVHTVDAYLDSYTKVGGGRLVAVKEGWGLRGRLACGARGELWLLPICSHRLRNPLLSRAAEGQPGGQAGRAAASL